MQIVYLSVAYEADNELSHKEVKEQAAKLLSEMENLLGKASLSLYDSSVELD